MKSWMIPLHDEMPSEEMIAWLSEMNQEWDGDEGGITISPPDGGDAKLGRPGDYVVEKNGVYYIVTREEINSRAQICFDLGVLS